MGAGRRQGQGTPLESWAVSLPAIGPLVGAVRTGAVSGSSRPAMLGESAGCEHVCFMPPARLRAGGRAPTAAKGRRLSRRTIGPVTGPS